MSTLTLPNTIANGTPADGTKVQQNYETIANYANTETIVRDGTVGFSQPIAGQTPTASTHLATKGYVDGLASPSAWTNVTYQNSWVDYNTATHHRVQYRLVGDEVQIRGTMKDGTVGEAAFTLPEGHRPAKFSIFPVVAGGQPAVASIATSGVVTVTTGSNAYVSFAISFSIAA